MLLKPKNANRNNGRERGDAGLMQGNAGLIRIQ